MIFFLVHNSRYIISIAKEYGIDDGLTKSSSRKWGVLSSLITLIE